MATPIYKAAYSGLLKTFLDLPPHHALAGIRCFPWPPRQPGPRPRPRLRAAPGPHLTRRPGLPEPVRPGPAHHDRPGRRDGPRPRRREATGPHHRPVRPRPPTPPTPGRRLTTTGPPPARQPSTPAHWGSPSRLVRDGGCPG
ncbi:hypothetical protein ACFWV1_25790 [Streptomyces sp. NPDC058700]|uniref:hypothetical protein n=1 Tax=Streptomyces sp. NPDC058700 TaxID=3346607 RepID=UPI003655C51E